MTGLLTRVRYAGVAGVVGRLRRAVGLAPSGSEWVVRRRPGVAPRKLVALSFDDGPADGTGAVLDLLAEHGARASFFVVGDQIEGREELVRRMLDGGHELGNHLWSHPVAAELADDELRTEIARTRDAIATLSGAPPRLLRTPFFSAAERAALLARNEGHELNVLGILGYDWIYTDPRAVADALLARVAPGEILILHDGVGAGTKGHADREVTVAALGLLLPELDRRGYEVVSVSELIDASA